MRPPSRGGTVAEREERRTERLVLGELPADLDAAAEEERGLGRVRDLGDDLGPQRVRMEDLTGTAGAGGEQEDALASEAKRLPPPGGLGLGLGLGRTDVDTVTGEGLALGVGEVEGAGEAGALAGEVPPDHEVGGVQEGPGVAEELQACLGGGFIEKVYETVLKKYM